MVKIIAKALKGLMDMTHMSVQDIHKRLMLFKMVREVLEIKERERNNEDLSCNQWLCNLCLKEDTGKQEKLLCP